VKLAGMPKMETKQFASVGPHGSTTSAPGSVVSPGAKGLDLGAAKTKGTRNDPNKNTKTKNKNKFFMRFWAIQVLKMLLYFNIFMLVSAEKNCG
jgi:hypothetical protein